MNAPTEADVIEFLPMVQRIARKLGRKLHGVPVEDLVSAGSLGLVQALGRRPAAISNEELPRYVSRRVKGAMLDHARANSPAYRQLRAARRAHQRAVDRVGPLASTETVAQAIGLSVSAYEQHQRFLAGEFVATHVQYDDELCPSRDSGVDQALADTQDFLRAWGALPDALRTVMQLHYVDGVENREIARRLGVHESRVSQLQRKAVDQMRRVVAEDAPMAA